jgi:hypothetical protein
MIEMIGDFWQQMLAVLLISTIASFLSSKSGVILSSLISLGYVSFTVLFSVGGFPGTEKFLIVGLFLIPTIAWSGFFIGSFFKKNRKK